MKFSKLASLNVSARVVPFRIPFSESLSLVLSVAFAGKDNAPYWNAYLAQSTGLDKKLGKASQKGKSQMISKLMHGLQQEQDRLAPKLYAEHIIKGWYEEVTDDEGVVVQQPVTDEGVVVPFSVEHALDLTAQLPGHVFDDLKSFCQEPSNFVEELDAEATVKNS